LPNNGNNPTITPFAIHMGQLSACFFSIGLHLAALPSLPFWERLQPSLQVLATPVNHQSHQSTPFLTQKDHYNQMVCHIISEECINHARPGMIYQASHQGLQHPLKRKFLFSSATVIIWVSQYDHELTTLPRVYSSRSCVCPLFHPRNHNLLLHESLALSLKSPGSFPPLLMGTAH
jgi:hypothetical protein